MKQKNSISHFSIHSLKVTKLVCVVLAIASILGTTTSSADENKKVVIYIGGGTADSGNPLQSSDKPKSIGFFSSSKDGGPNIGFDVGREGTHLDSTWGNSNEVSQATSFNLLIGGNLSRSESTSIDGMFLIGMMKVATYCPAGLNFSYLGYQCYADTKPETSYDVNIGAVITLTYEFITLGGRLTGNSVQTILGISF